MNSSISHFSWIGLAVAGFVVIEAAIGWWAPRPDALRNSFLELAFAKPEMVQRAFVAEKVLHFDDLKPDIIQVGDSSGLHAVQSPIVESYLGGRSYLNLSVASNLGYPGYLALARRMMERSGSVKALVLYFTPGGGAPRQALVDARDLMGSDLTREFASPFNRLFQVPSLGVRREITDRILYLNGTFNSLDRPLVSNSGYLMLKDIIDASGGWARETDTPDDSIAGLFRMMRFGNPGLAAADDDGIARYRMAGSAEIEYKFEWNTLLQRSYIEIIFDQYLSLARQHGAQLVVITNPMPTAFKREAFRFSFDMDGIAKELDTYARRHADVSILNIDYWPDSKFSVFSHVGTPYAVESSHRVGRFLADLLPKLPPAAGKKLPYVAPRDVTLDMAAFPTVYGFSDTEKAGAHQFRRIRQGRYEALAYARVNPAVAQELRIAVINKEADAVLRDVSVGIYGVAATRLPDVQEGETRYLRFALPQEETRRFDGWIEFMLSTRGKAIWAGDELHATANGPELMVARIEIRPAA